MALIRAAALMAACIAGSRAAAAPAQCGRLAVRGGRFVDGCGRQALLRGINQVWKAPPWVADPTQFLPGGNSISDADAALWQSLGWNLVRLGTMWAGVMPTSDGQPNTTYTAQLAALSAHLAQSYGVLTLADAHQDLFSDRFCADGAPAWIAAAYSNGSAAFPLPLAQPYPFGPDGTPSVPCTLAWGDYYASAATSKAFGTLYGSERGVSDYVVFWTALLAAYAADPAASDALVLAEIINEPWAGDIYEDPLLMVPGVADRVNLQPFYAQVAARLQVALGSMGLSGNGTTPSPIMAYEPVTWDNFVPAFEWLPGGINSTGSGAPAPAPPNTTFGGIVLSHHFYALPDIIGSRWEIEARAADAARLGAAALLTEFDVDLVSPVNAPYSALDLRATLDACDATTQGYVGWAYSSVFNGSALVLPALAEMSRPFPLAIAGSNASYGFSAGNWSVAAAAAGATGAAFNLSYAHDCGVGAAAPTEIFLSTAFWFTGAAGPRVALSSVPAGAVSWQLRAVNGTTAVAQAGVQYTTASPPPPFAYAVLEVASGSACAAGAQAAVSVTVTA